MTRKAALFVHSGKVGRETAMFSHMMIGTNDLEKAKGF